MGRVRGVHDRVVHRLLPLLSAPHSVRTGHLIQDRLSRRLRFGRGYQVSAEISHLGGPHSGPHFCDLRTLHSPRLHARLEASENKFKCPCHGSGYDSEGVNFEGPAPRPMDRAKSRSLPTARFWWMFPSSTNGPRDSPARSTIRGVSANLENCRALLDWAGEDTCLTRGWEEV